VEEEAAAVVVVAVAVEEEGVGAAAGVVEVPPAAIRTAAEVMAAVRARGWTDALWEEVGRLRSDADVVRIFQAYDGEVCVCVCFRQRICIHTPGG
jgi:uncharacterized protein (DUF697 family)